MLSKMGWSEGQTLGKNDGGLVEPVSEYIAEKLFSCIDYLKFFKVCFCFEI